MTEGVIAVKLAVVCMGVTLLLLGGCGLRQGGQEPGAGGAQTGQGQGAVSQPIPHSGNRSTGGGQGAEKGSGTVRADRSDTGVFVGEEIVPPLPAPGFTLTDYTGKRVALKDFRGKVILLGFVYTGCPDICPRIAKSYTVVQQELGDAVGKRLELVFISVDPEGDTPERARKWTEAFKGKWHYLVGDRRTLEEVWDQYAIVVEKGQSGVGHSVKTYLIDQQGLVRVRYGGLGWEKAAINDIRKLLGG